MSLLALALVLAAAPAAEAKGQQNVIFYNSRLALREGKPAESVKLWLLHNSLRDLSGERGGYENDFRSVTWASMGSLGLCGDGFPRDDVEGAGLWPLAVHNWVVVAGRAPDPQTRNPFDAFEAGRQQREISIHDVLSTSELKTVNFIRSPKCGLPKQVLGELHVNETVDFTDRYQLARMLRRLLQRALDTLVRNKVQTTAVIETRMFDLDLTLVRLARAQLRREGAFAQNRARLAGVSAEGAQETREAMEKWKPDSPQYAFLQKSLGWRTDEWLSLSPERRLYLYYQARTVTEDATVLDPLMLGMIDALIAKRDGKELSLWLGWFDATRPDRQALLVQGARGKAMLQLEASTGFTERAVVSLHRGVAFLAAGDKHAALSAFAFAMQTAEDSRESTAVLGLARRWMSYVLSSFQTSDEIIATLKALVPKQEYNAVVEDLLWRAALRADLRSFEKVVASARRGGAFDARAERLRSLARGNPGALATELRDASTDEPALTTRFIKTLLEKLEAEDADVRQNNVPLVKLMVQVLDQIAGGAGKNRSQARTAEELAARGQAMLNGLRHFDTSEQGRAKALAPTAEAFAGNVRLAPTDPLPWPFSAPEPEQPSPFTALTLKPVEWNANGRMVFGWSITE